VLFASPGLLPLLLLWALAMAFLNRQSLLNYFGLMFNGTLITVVAWTMIRWVGLSKLLGLLIGLASFIVVAVVFIVNASLLEKRQL
jgi:hypothetical protein